MTEKRNAARRALINLIEFNDELDPESAVLVLEFIYELESTIEVLKAAQPKPSEEPIKEHVRHSSASPGDAEPML